MYKMSKEEINGTSGMKCSNCNSTDIKATIKDEIACVACEISYDCNLCGSNIDYFAYGSYLSEVYQDAT